MASSSRIFTSLPDSAPNDTPLLIGLMGPPGGGKTKSALLLGEGMARIRGGRIKLLDTEAKRSRKYKSQIDFDLIPFDPPFRSDDFEAAILQAAADRPAAIIIDSLSDEHEGIGGMLEWHEEEIDRRLGADKDKWNRREAMSQAGWIKPKAARRRLINTMLQQSVPLICTFRAREKTKPVQDANGKSVPTNIGFQPIAPAEIIHAMDMTCLLPPRAEGVPTWRGLNSYEDFTIKLPDYLRGIFATGGPITPEIGVALAKWQRGDLDAVRPTATMPRRTLEDALRDEARKGTWALQQARRALQDKHLARAQAIECELDDLAEQADAGDDGVPTSNRFPDEADVERSEAA